MTQRTALQYSIEPSFAPVAQVLPVIKSIKTTRRFQVMYNSKRDDYAIGPPKLN